MGLHAFANSIFYRFFTDFSQVLKIKNTSKNKVIFKVKTTQPNWYYVRPNQQVLDVNGSEDVGIVIVDTEMKWVAFVFIYFYESEFYFIFL